MSGEARFGLALTLAALVVWLCWRGTAQQSATPTRESVEGTPDEALAFLEPAAPVGRPRSTPVSSSPGAPRLALSVEQPVTALDGEEGAHPHPITPQHEALREQAQLVGALNDALDQRDAPGLRALIERYDAIAPEDPQRLAEGYERVADCLEASDPARRASARANAQRYYDDALASNLRRYVRRVCLEPSASAP